ncbi:MAG: hypothetical protein ACM3NQ_01605 [Bacteroidales bacterium]
MRSRFLALAVITATGVAVGAALGTGVIGGRSSSTADTGVSTSEHPVTVPTSLRTVSVSYEMPMPSARPRSISATLIEGSLPKTRVMAEVLTDTECSPDANMISRCRNEMRLSNGEKIVVRHPHDMRHIPCLAPGEKVRLVPTA